ncbi:MAG: beta-N-acetylhexosaminidase [Gammaproteobacteria bacterium]|nr:beta-N-acetylhexosaminidase [Gammaproteobacteria bacterium]NNF59783.1 beta-N-acetylhexosaminidase [Gammaproteobacteria bacterium]NNM20977.1 beta-N-acetylhexosaminidase [Gammaproteobacteria bacterium]
MTLGPLMVDVAGLELSPEDVELLQRPAIGGVILFKRNFESLQQLQHLTEQIHAVRKPPLLIAVDQEGGRVQRFGNPFTRLPSAARIGRHHDVDQDAAARLARSTGWLMAAELIASGVDLSFAPVVDIDHELCAVIGDRAFHHDAHTVAELGSAYISGMHDAGMAATAKHFPGHGGVAGDSHLMLPVDERSLVDLQADMRPYELLIANGLDAVMMALVAYPVVDEVPASFSRRWIRDELRGRLGFRGAVFSDDLSMAGAADAGSMRRRVNKALDAGCDVVLICNDRAAVESVVDRIDTHNPAAQARMASLHRRHRITWEKLKYSGRWQRARDLIDAHPALQLDG